MFRKASIAVALLLKASIVPAIKLQTSPMLLATTEKLVPTKHEFAPKGMIRGGIAELPNITTDPVDNFGKIESLGVWRDEVKNRAVKGGKYKGLEKNSDGIKYGFSKFFDKMQDKKA